MTKPKRVRLGELRYPAGSAPSADSEDENHQSHTAWTFAKFELDYLYDLLIDLTSGHAANERSTIVTDAPKWPLPTESEVRDCLQKTFIQDSALQQATNQLLHPYRRKYSPAMAIAVRHTVFRTIREQIDQGITPDPLSPDYDLFCVVGRDGDGTLPKTPEQYNRDMEVAVEIEEKLMRGEHLDLMSETQRIRGLVKETPLAYSDWDRFLWSDFLDDVFTYSTRFTVEITNADPGPNKPSPRQKSSAPVVPDTQILRRMRRQTARTVSHQIGHAYFTDDVIDDFLQHVKT